MKKDKELLAYFAGFFDGEGCIGVYKRKPGKAHRSPCYYIYASITQTDISVLNLFKAIYGGSMTLYRSSPIFPNAKKLYFWQLSCNKAEKFLKDIQPNLIVKKERVDLALKFRRIQRSLRTRGKAKTPEELDIYETYRVKIKQLNH